MRSFFQIMLPKPKALAVVLAGVGGALAISALLLLGSATELLMVIAPFGASCVLMFALPAAPLSQPVNVVGGHVVAAFAGMLALAFFPSEWWGAAFGVGLAISGMMALRVTHPPAGANPIVIYGLQPGWEFMIVPILIGPILLVVIATLYHRATGGTYPSKS
ncbi:MAG: HPP family protein [Pseudomonadota bacterium]